MYRFDAEQWDHLNAGAEKELPLSWNNNERQTEPDIVELLSLWHLRFLSFLLQSVQTNLLKFQAFIVPEIYQRAFFKLGPAKRFKNWGLCWQLTQWKWIHRWGVSW